MSKSQNNLSRENDDRFRKPGIVAPIIFLIITLVFIYGFTFIALLGLANWLIHAYSLEYFLNAGNLGITIMAFLILFVWVACAFILAAIPYFFFKFNHRPILAKKIALIILFFLFLSYTLPWILWPIIRRNSPTLSKRYRQKLKIMAKGPIMEQRLAERQARLNKI